jgi:K+-transporting ATPase KdpF subunit
MYGAAPCSVAKTARTRGGKMSAENIVGAIVTILVLVYLFYSLLRPEKF